MSYTEWQLCELKFGRRIYALGQEPEPPPGRRPGEPEIAPTVKDRVGWQEYQLVYSGNRSEIVAFMERLAGAVWLVRVNELRVEVIPPPREDGDPTFGEEDPIDTHAACGTIGRMKTPSC